MGARIPHLILLPQLMELVTVNGELDKVQVIALNAEVQVPKPEYKAVCGWRFSGSMGLKGSTQILLGPHPTQ